MFQFQAIKFCTLGLLLCQLIFTSSVNAQGIVCGLQAPFPDTWNPPEGPQPAWIQLAKERVERTRAVRNKLGTKIQASFDKIPWRQALADLAAEADITIHIGEANIGEADAASNTPANINTIASLREVLHLVLEPNNLMFTVREWGLEITTIEQANEERLTCMLDMSVFLPDSSNTTELVTVITQQIDPDTWDLSGGANQISSIGSMLVVTATDSTIANIEHFCSQIARQQMRNLSFTPHAIPDTATPKSTPVISLQAPVPWDSPTNKLVAALSGHACRWPM